MDRRAARLDVHRRPGAATTQPRGEDLMNDGIRVERGATAGAGAHTANRGRHHRHRRPSPAGGMWRRQPAIGLSGGSPRAAESSRSPSAVAYPACMRSHGCRISPTPTAAERSLRPTRSISGSAVPSSRRPTEPASPRTRTTAGRLASRSDNARRPSTVHRGWCGK